MNEEYIKVLKVNPMEHPRVVVIPNNVTTLNTIVSTGSDYRCRAEALLIAPYVGVIRAPCLRVHRPCHAVYGY